MLEEKHSAGSACTLLPGSLSEVVSYFWLVISLLQ